MLLSDICFFFISVSHLFSIELNHSCYFGRGQYEKHLCEIILNLDRWRRCVIKIFLFLALDLLSGSQIVWGSQTVCAVLRGRSVKLFCIRVSD